MFLRVLGLWVLRCVTGEIGYFWWLSVVWGLFFVFSWLWACGVGFSCLWVWGLGGFWGLDLDLLVGLDLDFRLFLGLRLAFGFMFEC